MRLWYALLLTACASVPVRVTVAQHESSAGSSGSAGAAGSESAKEGEAGDVFWDGPIELRHGEPVRVRNGQSAPYAGAGGMVEWSHGREI